MSPETQLTYSTIDKADRYLGEGQPWQNVIVVMPGYQAGASSQTAGEGNIILRLFASIWRGVTSTNYKSYIRIYRDFYANPRSEDYMLERVKEFVSAVCPDCNIQILIQEGFSGKTYKDNKSNNRVQILEYSGNKKNTLNAIISKMSGEIGDSKVLFIHPDAIGLGQYENERVLLDKFPGRVFVLNGRRRIYKLTSKMHKKVVFRRFLVETRLPEAVASLLIWPLSLISFILHPAKLK